MGRFTQSRDVYYRKAKELGFRARSAFKLLQVNEEFGILEGVSRAVDLCAAPGSWSQVLSRKLKDKQGSKIVAVDLQNMAPIPGVHTIQGDITTEKISEEITAHFDGCLADVVTCDGAPDVTGLHEMDEFIQSQLLVAAINIATRVLREGGSFVAKIFRADCYRLLEAQMALFFDHIDVFKPLSSRTRSAEHFIVGRGFHHPNTNQLPLGKPILFVPVLKSGDLKNSEQYDTTKSVSHENSFLRFLTPETDMEGY